MPIYMKYDGVTGGVTESSHTGWIELKSFNWGLGRSISTIVGSVDDREASAPSVSEIVVTKDNDVASGGLMQESLTGFGKNVRIDFCRTAKGQLDVYLTLTLTNTMISGYTHSCAGGDSDRPAESLSLNFTKFDFQTTQMNPDANQGQNSHVVYDLATAQAG